jgi:hypothetical protein
LVPSYDDERTADPDDGPGQPTLGGRPVRGRVRGDVRRCLALACALVVAVTVSGCGPHLSQLSFRVDKRLHFVAPKDRALVQAPLTLSWTMRDFSGTFAVFVDTTPIKPGQTLKAIAKDDNACRVNPKCPDANYLALRQIYTTTTTSVTIPRVAQLTDTGDDTQLHDVIIVLLDGTGHRIGESAWHTTFKMKKRKF